MSLDKVIFLSNVRLSFPHLIDPQITKNEKTGKERASYNAEFIMAPDHPGFAQFWQLVNAMAVEKWKEHATNVLGLVQQDRKKRCYGSGDEKINQKTFQVYDGYAGNRFITAGRDTRPQAIQEDGTPVDPANTMAYQAVMRKCYGGCRVNAAVKPWLQENEHGRGVRCDLVAVQFLGDDTPFGEGAVDASSLFGATAAPAPAGMPAFMQQPAQAAPAMPPAPFAGNPGVPSFLQQR